MEERLKEALIALASMYGQYCSEEGHLFMGAGERASALLEKELGFTFDLAGRGENPYHAIDKESKEELLRFLK